MSSQQKRGFRLPWAVERSTDEGAAAATLEAESEPTTPDRIEGGVGDELGEGPFHYAESSTPDASTDASPEAPDVPQTTAEAAMIESETATTKPGEATPPVADHDTWPTSDQRLASTPEPVATPGEEASGEPAATPAPTLPPIHVEGEARASRANPLVAGLIRAMREAALASRDETTSRLQAEATARVESIREAGATQAAALRKRADEDVAGIREWSKAEIARIKQETDERIENRRTELEGQSERHETNVDHHVAQVQATVAAFEADMDRFFEQLLAETDPARLASLAEQAPESPDLMGELPELSDEATEPAPSEWDGVAWGEPVPPDLADPEAIPALAADDAAAAEAAATVGLELPDGDVWPSSVLATARRTLHPAATDFEAAGVANARLFVNGLASVAGISAFKGALGQLPGVRSVSVSSGEPGVFIFTVVHSPETEMQSAIAELTAFSARVTEVSGDGLTVVAQEPAA